MIDMTAIQNLTGILAQTTQPTLDPLKLLTEVGDFYFNAWLMLIAVFTIGGVFVGIVLPFLLERKQVRTFENTKKDILDKVAAGIKNAETRTQSLEKKLEEQFKQLTQDAKDTEQRQEKKLRRMQAKLSGDIWDVQGDVMKLKNPVLCSYAYATAIMFYLDAEIKALVELECRKLREMLREYGVFQDSKQPEPEISKIIEEAIEALSNSNTDGKYDEQIKALKEEYKAAKKRAEADAKQDDEPDGGETDETGNEKTE